MKGCPRKMAEFVCANMLAVIIAVDSVLGVDQFACLDKIAATIVSREF